MIIIFFTYYCPVCSMLIGEQLHRVFVTLCWQCWWRICNSSI